MVRMEPLTEQFDAVDEAFYEYGVEQSSVEVTVDEVEGWFSGYDSVGSEHRTVEGVYWVEAPFVFVEVARTEGGVVKYNLVKPELSEREESVVDGVADVLDLSYHTLSRDEYEALAGVVEQVSAFVADSEEDGSVEVLKLIPYLVERSSPFGRVHYCSEDVNVSDVSVFSNAVARVSIQEPIYIEGAETTIVFSESDVGAFRDSVEPFLDVDESGVASGQVGSDTFVKVSESATGTRVTIEFYDNQTLTIPNMVATGTIDSTVAAYLWLAVDTGKNVMVSGPASSGKTAMLRAMRDYIPATDTVSVVDSEYELSSGRSHTQEYTRQNTDVYSASVIQRAVDSMIDYLIVDDISDPEEAEDIFHTMVNGTPVLGSMTAGAIDAFLHRLTNEPLSIPDPQVAAVDVVIQLDRLRVYNEGDDDVHTVYRMNDLFELTVQDNGFRVVNLVHRSKETDSFVRDIDNSSVFEKIGDDMGLPVTVGEGAGESMQRHESNSVQEELENRKQFIEAVVQCGVYDRESVREAFNAYSQDKSGAVKAASETLSEGTERVVEWINE